MATYALALARTSRHNIVLSPVRNSPGLQGVKAVAVPGHDTTCAYAAMPADGDLYFSSGAWSLGGFESGRPVLGPEALTACISNERMGEGRYRPLTNVSGLWLLEQALRDFKARPLRSGDRVSPRLPHGGTGYCDPVLWPQLQAAFAGDFTVETTFDRARTDDYQFGITAAARAIAETGTLILSNHGTSSRLGALAPWVQVVVRHRDQIHPDIPTALAAHPTDLIIIWVTGPSKIADVEGILIEGVYGSGMQVTLLTEWILAAAVGFAFRPLHMLFIQRKNSAFCRN